jgi:RNA polymerase sigma-70 factor (ECF subfamily)
MNQVQPILEAELIERSQRGDQAAYGELVRRYTRLVITVAARTGATGDLAQDLAQETFLRAWQNIRGFTPKGDNSFRAWLCRICHNLAVDALRRGRQVVELDEELSGGSAGDPASGNPAAAYLRNEAAAEVRALVDQLPDASRLVLALREFEGLSYGEISHALNIPVGTVMSRLNYARNALRKSLTVVGVAAR